MARAPPCLASMNRWMRAWAVVAAAAADLDCRIGRRAAPGARAGPLGTPPGPAASAAVDLQCPVAALARGTGRSLRHHRHRPRRTAMQGGRNSGMALTRRHQRYHRRCVRAAHRRSPRPLRRRDRPHAARRSGLGAPGYPSARDRSSARSLRSPAAGSPAPDRRYRISRWRWRRCARACPVLQRGDKSRAEGDLCCKIKFPIWLSMFAAAVDATARTRCGSSAIDHAA